jgi:hypothetical protein
MAEDKPGNKMASTIGRYTKAALDRLKEVPKKGKERIDRIKIKPPKSKK